MLCRSFDPPIFMAVQTFCRWSPSWYSAGLGMRISIAMNAHRVEAALHHPLGIYEFIPYTTGLSTAPIHSEYVRNCFWLTYAIDRSFAESFGWAHALADRQISQVLPTTANTLN